MSLYTPFANCGHKAEDGTCNHPGNSTPECHQHICPIRVNTAQQSVQSDGAKPSAKMCNEPDCHMCDFWMSQEPPRQ